jgi:hypothetical protein
MIVAPADGLGHADTAAVTWQLGRAPRGAIGVAHRCACGDPDVVTTAPRLPDGTPFPTTYYLTCPVAAASIGTLESQGVMREMEARLRSDLQLQSEYREAHESYLADRESIAVVEELDGISAGGMPSRVKCLHVLAAHSLAAGPGANPLGDEVLALVPQWSGCRALRTEDQS